MYARPDFELAVGGNETQDSMHRVLLYNSTVAVSEGREPLRGSAEKTHTRTRTQKRS